MNHVYEYNGYCFSAKNKKEVLEYYLEETGDYAISIKDFERQDNKEYLSIMMTECDNKKVNSGDVNIPENSKKTYLGEDDGFEDYTWLICAKCGDWANINDGFLCKEIE
jgi:hypothetical protein